MIRLCGIICGIRRWHNMMVSFGAGVSYDGIIRWYHSVVLYGRYTVVTPSWPREHTWAQLNKALRTPMESGVFYATGPWRGLSMPFIVNRIPGQGPWLG